MILDWGYYEYLNDRLNATVLQFVETGNLSISLAMVWETYPIIWIVSGFLVFCSGLYWIIKKFLLVDETHVVDPRSRKIFRVFFFLSAAFLSPGKLDTLLAFS